MRIVELVLTLAAVGQLIVAFVLYDALRINLRWGVLMISALFGLWPILTFRRRGGVQRRGYTETTVLGDSDLYSIVRHPQYQAGVLINIALTLITPHWSVAIPGWSGCSSPILVSGGRRAGMPGEVRPSLRAVHGTGPAHELPSGHRAPPAAGQDRRHLSTPGPSPLRGHPRARTPTTNLAARPESGLTDAGDVV